MTDPQQVDLTYDFILRTFIDTGQAPHYSDIARHFGVPPEEGKRLLHDLMDGSKLPIWLQPGTHLIASFAPFNSLPNQYRITIDGHQRWFAQ